MCTCFRCHFEWECFLNFFFRVFNISVWISNDFCVLILYSATLAEFIRSNRFILSSLGFYFFHTLLPSLPDKITFYSLLLYIFYFRCFM
jgi:hypothetical protein